VNRGLSQFGWNFSVRTTTLGRRGDVSTGWME